MLLWVCAKTFLTLSRPISLPTALEMYFTYWFLCHDYSLMVILAFPVFEGFHFPGIAG